MPTEVPLIKLLAIVLPIYLLSFGGFLFYFGQSKRKSHTYWIGGGLLVLLSVSIIIGGPTMSSLIVSRQTDYLFYLSILNGNALICKVMLLSGLQNGPKYPSVFQNGVFIRHQKVKHTQDRFSQKRWTLIQGSAVQLRDLFVEPWYPTTYVEEKFLTLDTEQLPHILENTWHVTEKEIIYLGNVKPKESSELESKLSTTRLRLQVTPKLPPDEELEGTRRTFAQILQRDYVLRYLADPNSSPYFIGWTSQSFTDMVGDGHVSTNDETLVILRPGAGP